MYHSRKTLILVIRRESVEDFKSILNRIKKLDPTIDVVVFEIAINFSQIPSHLIRQPSLIIYLVNPTLIAPPNSTVLAVKRMNKLEQSKHFETHELPYLPISEFQWGMDLDKEIYGDWVILKPQNLQSSGKDINMIATKDVASLRLSDFPEDHLIHKDSFYVQKFIKFGKTPYHYRVMVFLDEILYSYESISEIEYSAASVNLKSQLTTSVASNLKNRRKINIVKHDDCNELAVRVAKSLPNNPIFGMDIIKDEVTGKLYILELNSGGNVWHFSSAQSKKPGGVGIYRKELVLQYKAWERAAEALVRKTQELAS